MRGRLSTPVEPLARRELPIYHITSRQSPRCSYFGLIHATRALPPSASGGVGQWVRAQLARGCCIFHSSVQTRAVMQSEKALRNTALSIQESENHTHRKTRTSYIAFIPAGTGAFLSQHRRPVEQNVQPRCETEALLRELQVDLGDKGT